MMINKNSSQTYANDSNVKEISTLLDGKNKPDDEQNDGDITPPDQAASAQVSNEKPAIESHETPAPESSDPQTDDAVISDAVSLKDLAATLNVETKDLYDVEIPIGADKVAKLGDLKDTFKKFEVMQRDHEQYEQNKTRNDNEMMVARRQLESLINLGAKSGALTPEIVDLVDRQHAETVTREKHALYNAIPEWNDIATRQTDFDAMASMVSTYGFSRGDLESVVDHRLIKFINDMTKRINLVEDAKKKQAIPKNTGKSNRQIQPSKSALQKRIATAKTGSQSQKVEAISSLIN